jgi:hypothetical protein
MKNLFNNISQEEKNRILEMHSSKKNVILEEVSDDDNIINQIIKMDKDFDNDPLYKQYEKQYLRDKFRETLSAGNLGVMSDASDEMIDMLVSLGNQSSNVEITPEMVINNKDKTIEHTMVIRDMAAADNEFDLAIKLRDYIELLQKLE